MPNLLLRLTWSQTNDYFDIEVENPEFALWFVEQSNNSSYTYKGSLPIQDKLIADLKSNIEEINSILQKINLPTLPILEDMYSQYNLNSTHKNWISIVRKEPRIDQILYHVSPELFKKFHDINQLVHAIEQNFKYQLEGNSLRRVENKFKNILPTYGVYNVFINYSDWGKSSWHKFVDGAEEPNDFELSNWNTIGSDITINLSTPHRLTFSSDYLNYCSQNQIPVSIHTWPLGNLVDYKNTMPEVRNVMNRNIQIPNNSLNFSII